MQKFEEKNKVGRPKLADEELIKDSWCKIASCSVVAIVMLVCAIGIMTERTPFQVLTFKIPQVKDIQANVVRKAPVKVTQTKVISARKIKTKVINPNKVSTRIIDTDGNVTKVIPARTAKIILPN